jgi:hypothetical protein
MKSPALSGCFGLTGNQQGFKGGRFEAMSKQRDDWMTREKSQLQRRKKAEFIE